MMPTALRWRRWILPAGVFLTVGVAHFLWLGFVPERDAAQAQWVSVRSDWLEEYIEARSYWLGFSYSLSLAFAVAAWRRYREGRFCAARNLAIGGVTFSGVLSVTGCYLLGCCGSPMLGVYLSLFGAAFVPLAKPLVAGGTAVSVLIGWWWMNRRAGEGPADASANLGCGGACAGACDPSAVGGRRGQH